ncbi:RDD family protein [uncultured Amphritea sp.]|uniref:RDD family protein n=1 Tax=uncultured Amphritea sp. TaxID=981605 RepID=UPI00262439A0|nr:RDD family protein [uncultured Amphritea sp.]
MNDENIYSTPHANLEVYSKNEVVLAGRWTRFWAALIDTILILLLFIVVQVALGVSSLLTLDQLPQASELMMSVGILLSYLLLNGYLLATSGQTIAKKMFNIRVVDYDTNQLLPFSKVFGIRYLPIFVISQIPFAGQFIGIIDSLFIFSKENRCLHDLLANTKVIKI